jgi:hypothetical protein
MSIAFITNAQNIIAYTYDVSGNMIQRQLQVIPPIPGAKFSNPFSNPEEKNDSLNVIQFKVYPNPSNDVLNIEGDLPSETESAQMFLFNTTGQILLSYKYYGDKKQINVNSFKAGLYYLEVKYSKKHSSNYKIIITK